MIDIQPIEADNKHFVEATIHGEVKRYGPYSGADTAGAAARQIAAIYRMFYWGDPQPVPRPTLRRAIGGSRRG